MGMVMRFGRWIDARLQRKFTLILASILMAASFGFGLMVVGLYQNQLLKEHTRASLQVNHLLQASLENAMLKRDIEGLRAIVANLGVQRGIAAVMILSPEMEVRFSSDPARLGEMLDNEEVQEALRAQSQRTAFISDANNIERLRSVNPVPNRQICGECHGVVADNPVNGLLIVDYEATNIRTDALKSALMLGGLGGFVVLATGLGVWIALRRLVISRLRTLHKASRRFAEGALDARAELAGRDEIAELGAGFDTMAGRLGRTLKELNAAGDFLQGVIDAIPDGVRVIDDSFKIIKANQAYCRQAGQSMNEVLGAKCFKSSHNRDEPCPVTLVSCPVAELGPDLPVLTTRHQHIPADGSELFVEVSAARAELMIEGENVPCVIESIRDLAEQARISHEQRLSELGLLATGVAHEIHNPLSSIQLALKAIQTDLGDTDAVQFSLEYFEIAEAEIGKCLKVTDGLMMLSEPPSKTPGLIALDRIIPEVFALLAYQAEQAKISVELDLAENLRVIASDSDMRMMVINLAQNAFHAMPVGGKLHVTGWRKGAWIELAFTDTGSGILKNNLSKIFLPFWTKRADASAGRGLGLSICKAIIERAEGSISVESTVGTGTCFTIVLPNADSDG